MISKGFSLGVLLAKSFGGKYHELHLRADFGLPVILVLRILLPVEIRGPQAKEVGFVRT